MLAGPLQNGVRSNHLLLNKVDCLWIYSIHHPLEIMYQVSFPYQWKRWIFVFSEPGCHCFCLWLSGGRHPYRVEQPCSQVRLRQHFLEARMYSVPRMMDLSLHYCKRSRPSHGRETLATLMNLLRDQIYAVLLPFAFYLHPWYDSARTVRTRMLYKVHEL